MQATIEDTTGSMTQNTETFDEAVEAARDAALIRVDDPSNTAIPFAEYEEGSMARVIAQAMAPCGLLLDRVFNEPDADEVDGVGPTTPRHAQTFVADAQLAADGDDANTAFRLLDKYQNRFNDLKIVVDAPAPWKAPDDLQAPNDLIKSIGEWEEHHWDMAEPSSVGVEAEDKVWTLDASALQPLQETLAESGYEWVDARDDDNDDNDETDVLDAVAGFVAEGDDITVRYDMANGDGVGEKAGRVDAAYEGEGRGVSKAVSFTRDDGNVNRIKYDDNGEPSIFSGGYYPFMGQILSVAVEPADNE